MLLRPLKLLQVVGYMEGTSFLLLLLVGMPLKYWAGQPDANLIIGGMHGAMWIAYLLVAIRAAWFEKWGVVLCSAALVASIVPLGPFVFDWWLRRRNASIPQSRETSVS